MKNFELLYEEIVKNQRKITELTYDLWAKHCLFSFQWWLQTIFLLAPWFLWWKLVDRKRLKEIIIYGLLVIILTSYLDEVGSELTLWAYPFKITPVFPRFITADFTILPVTYMLIYQYFPTWKSFSLAIILVAAILAFIGEPVLIWLKIYKMYNWSHVYSFPIYIITAISLRWLTKTIVCKQQNNVR